MGLIDDELEARVLELFTFEVLICFLLPTFSAAGAVHCGHCFDLIPVSGKCRLKDSNHGYDDA